MKSKKPALRVLPVFLVLVLSATGAGFPSTSEGQQGRGVRPVLGPGEKILIIPPSAFDVFRPPANNFQKGLFLTYEGNSVLAEQTQFIAPLMLPVGTLLKRVDMVCVDDTSATNIDLELTVHSVRSSGGISFHYGVDSGTGSPSPANRTFSSVQKWVKMHTRSYSVIVTFPKDTPKFKLKLNHVRIIYKP